MDGETVSETQLADSRPQFDTPLRVAIPVNAPPRNSKKSKDEYIRANAFSPAAQVKSKQTLEAFFSENPIQIQSSSIQSILNMEGDSTVKTSIRDFSVLAFSSKRAEKKDIEATAYVSLGVIYDNQGDYKQSITQYLQYLQICEEVSDSLGTACACNCLAVNYMLLASPPSDAGTIQGVIKSSQSIEYLNKAIHFNLKHLEIGPDSGGRFVANTNLGLCYGMIGDIIQSAKYHQDALRIAIRMQTLYGQAIAVGNLGLLALVKKDFTTARTCFDQHLQLLQTLSDAEGEISAWKMLAKLAYAQDDLPQALAYLETAKTISERELYQNELRRIHCLIGLYKGKMTFASRLDEIVQDFAMGIKVGGVGGGGGGGGGFVYGSRGGGGAGGGVLEEKNWFDDEK